MSDLDPRPIHVALQIEMNGEDAREAQGNVVTGWVCIAETMAPDGTKRLAKMSADASGDRRLPRWAEQGLLHNALHGDGKEGWQP